MRISDWSSDVCSSDLWRAPLYLELEAKPCRDACRCSGTLPATSGRAQVHCRYLREGCSRSNLHHFPRANPIARTREELQLASRLKLPLLQRTLKPPRPRKAYPRSSQFPQRSEEHTSELQSLMRLSYAVF